MDEMRKPFPIAVACLLLGIFGLLDLGVGPIILNEVFDVAGVGALVWAAGEMVAGYALWKLKRWGAYMAIIISVLRIISLLSASWTIVSFAHMALSAIIVALVILNWRNLNPPTTADRPPESTVGPR